MIFNLLIVTFNNCLIVYLLTDQKMINLTDLVKTYSEVNIYKTAS